MIPVLDAVDTLPAQMEALSRQTYRGKWELIVADNGSTDGSIEGAMGWEGRFSRLYIVDASAQRGPGYARNVGAKSSTGDLIAFCDADDVVDPGWLSGLVAVASIGDLVGGAVNPSARSLMTVMGGFPHASGCSMGIWRDVFERIGGFDSRFLAAQDVELSWRAQLLGFDLVFAPDALMQRGRRPDLKGVWIQQFRYGFWGALLYREYKGRAVPEVSRLSFVRRLIWLAVRFPYLVMSESRRRVWIRRAAYGAGALAGSWKHRVTYMP